MSAILTQLVGRATGAIAPGLRPRLPAMFESAPVPDGLTEIASEMLARPAHADHQPPPRPLAPAATGNPPAPAAALDQPPAPAQATAASPDLPGPLLDVAETVSPPRPTARPGHEAPALRPGDLRAPPPTWPTVGDGPEARNGPRDAAPLAAMLPPAATASPRREAPAALLPAPPDTRLDALVVGRLAADRPQVAKHTARAAASPQTAVTAEPEIAIHIGRLDIRTEPERPAPRRAAAPSALPSLSDYLRGVRR